MKYQNIEKSSLRRTVAIYTYNSGLLGLTKDWRFSYTVTWADYENMAKNMTGEGETWRAQPI